MAQEIIVEDGAAINGEITTVTADMLPKIVYKGVPVIPSDLLAKVYGVETVCIRMNFSRNKDRFVEGKHFFSVTGKEIKELMEGVTLGYALSPHMKGSRITVWTHRGAARQAKLINTDAAWEVFEQLEDTFFAVMNGDIPAPTTPQPLTHSTPHDRQPLKELVDAWVGSSPISYHTAWKQVHAHFGITAIGDLPKEWIPDAIAFVQARIDKVQARIEAREVKALPAAGPDLKAMSAEYYHFVIDTQIKHTQLMAEVERKSRELTAVLGAIITPHIGQDNDPSAIVARSKFLDALNANPRSAIRAMDMGIIALMDHAQLMCGLSVLGR